MNGLQGVRRRAARAVLRRGIGRSFVRTLILGAALILAPSPAAAQDAVQALASLESRYEGRLAEYEGAMQAALAQREFWEDRVAALDQSRRFGVAEAEQAALDSLRVATLELERLEGRVRATREAADEARIALMDGLLDYRSELTVRFANSADAVEARRIESLLDDTSNQYARLEGEILPLDPVSALSVVSISYDPRDRAPGLLAKIQLLERYIQEVDSAVAEVEDLSADLETRRRMQQIGRDFEAGLERFGATQLLTGQRTPPSANGEGMPADSTALQLPVTLEEQIVEFHELKERLVSYREHLDHQAEALRERLRRITA